MMPRVRHRRSRHLRHRIFFALGFTIVFSVIVAGYVVHSIAASGGDPRSLVDFANDRFRAVWQDPMRRDDLAQSIERHFPVRLTLYDRGERVIYGTASECVRKVHRIAVTDGRETLGHVDACVLSRGTTKQLVIGLISVALVMWAMSGLIARRLVRPLDDLVRVVRAIGNGQLDARISLCQHHHRGEVGEVAEAVNAMAEKIERQIAGQRELLAAVSHEIRSPLARLRMLVELERDAQGPSERLDSMDMELGDMDTLVGQLLAQSRLEFQNLDRRTLPAVDIARQSLERAGVSAGTLVDESNRASVCVDATLFHRALLNLIENAERHGRGLTSIHVTADRDQVRFELRDAGPGFDPALIERVKLPFVGQGRGGGLGLGLALVDRIVSAHGGRVLITNGPGAGACVTIALDRQGTSEPT